MPNWHKIYCEEEPPIYYKILEREIKKINREFTVLEIGSGLGDILAMILNLGFKNVMGIERNKDYCNIANEKIKYFYSKSNDIILNKNYPVKINFNPDIYIQVNNVYYDQNFSKKDYLQTLREMVFYNNKPKYCFIEQIDSSFTQNSNAFPHYIRVSYIDMKNTFPEYIMQQIQTYIYPQNSSSKMMYCMKLKEYN
jgi:SAM-dependent methyltransferase